MDDADEISAAILRLLHARQPQASICPSDVARSLRQEEADWRALMPRVREVAGHLAAQGVVLVTQRGTPVAGDLPPRGPVRLRRGPRFE